MNESKQLEPKEALPPLGLGLASLVLATIALVLFVLPVLSVPIAACGVVLSLAGIASVPWRRSESLRWSLAGLCASSLALGIVLAIYYAPSYEEPSLDSQPLWQSPPVKPYVPPPAMPGEAGVRHAGRAGRVIS